MKMGNYKTAWGFKLFTLLVWMLLVFRIEYVQGTLPICSPTSGILTVNSPCRFPAKPATYFFTDLTINKPIFLESSNLLSSHKFNVTGKFRIGLLGALIVQWSKQSHVAKDGVSLGGHGSGGSHSGRGGSPKSRWLRPNETKPVGDPLKPLESGGNGGDGTSSGSGGKGGGSIKIVSTQCEIEGIIQANGIDAQVSKSGGGGAGGSVLLVCQQLSGRPVLEANGGRGDGDGGGGSGGRISVHYQTGSLDGEIGMHAHGGKTGEWLFINFGIISSECIYSSHALLY